MSNQRLPAEWEPQDAILLVWPNSSDCKYYFDEIAQFYEAIVTVICDYSDIIIALAESEIENVRLRLFSMSVPLEYVYFYPIVRNDDFSDIAIRDHGPITVATDQGMKLLDFTISPLSKSHMKKPIHKISMQLQLQNAFPSAIDFETQDFSLEGSTLEADGDGALLVKSSGSFIKHLSKNDIETHLKNTFGVTKVNWLEHGNLATEDKYIDALVRFCPNNTIVYTSCDDEKDELYEELKKMESELKNMTNAQGLPYRLLPLPWPGTMFNDDDERISVSYASFLIVNEAVLVPIYDALSDEDALDVIFQAFPGFSIMGIPSTILITQGISLHRIAMQLPEGVLLTL